jgi:hypothetical protein
MNTAQQTTRDRKCDAFIIAHAGSQGMVEYLVRPAVSLIDGKHGPDTFLIRNLTGRDDVFVDLKGHGEPTGPQFVGPGKHDVVEFTVTTVDFSFDYEVKVGGDRAHGNSDPVIIIDPPA